MMVSVDCFMVRTIYMLWVDIVFLVDRRIKIYMIGFEMAEFP